MVNRSDYKDALGRIDRDIRICIKYLEGMMEEKFKLARKVLTPKISEAKVDLSRLESKDDSLQKQINGLRKKVDAAYSHIQNHDEDKIFLKKLAKRVEEMADEIQKTFEEIYNSGYYSEGTKRKIREAGLIKRNRK